MNSIISLGVGLQSTTLYYMSSMGILPPASMAIFADTGAERTKTKEYWEYLLLWQVHNSGIPLYLANYRNIEEDILPPFDKTGRHFVSIPSWIKNEEGEKAMLRRQCTSEYKIAQVTKKYRSLLEIGNKHFPKTEMLIGISFDERDRMAVPVDKWKIHNYPFCGYKIYPNGKTERNSEFVKTRNQLQKWLVDSSLPVPKKSSCKFCPFQGDKHWLDLKINSPADFEDACKVDDALRSNPYIKFKSPQYVHNSLIPLRQVVFKKRQKGFFEDHGNCSDICNI